MAMENPVVETPEIVESQVLQNKRMTKMEKQFPELAQELNNRRGFCDIVAEKHAYVLGRAGLVKKMNDANRKERETASDIKKTIRESIPKWIKEANTEEYEKQVQASKDASKIVSDMNKPFRTQITPLTRAIKFIDNIGVPSLLTELGYNVVPAITLSDLITKKLEEQKNN